MGENHYFVIHDFKNYQEGNLLMDIFYEKEEQDNTGKVLYVYGLDKESYSFVI
jgi:hypothetical protein